jgi:NAD+ synthase (glutamine-hydrolysing)
MTTHSLDRVRSVRLGAAALNQTPLDWDGNLRRARAAIDEARAAKVSMLCLPELALSGYGCEDLFLSPFLAQTSAESLAALVPHTEGMVVAVGLPVAHAGVLFNGVAVIADGALAAIVAKQSLAGDGIHYEPRWFRAWPARVRDVARLLGREVPIGDLRLDFGGVTMGFEICEDAWVAKRPGAALALDSVDVIFNPSASHFSFGKREVRRRLVAEGSRAFGVAYVYANLLGNEAGRAIYDGHTLISAPSLVRAPRRRLCGAPCGGGRAELPLEQRGGGVSDERRAGGGWGARPPAKQEEFTRAVALGLFDYLRKSKSRGFVVSLSGGADSAAIVYLIAAMVELACQELGLAGTCARLGQPLTADPRALVRQLLVCVYQATANSGAVTLNAARTVAEAVGAEFLVFDVERWSAATSARSRPRSAAS